MSLNLSRATSRKSGICLYGHAAASVGLALVWFAIWTLACNSLVLAGFHYPAFLWALAATILLTAIVGARFYCNVVGVYGPSDDLLNNEPRPVRPFSFRLVLAIATAAITAFWTQRTSNPLPFIGGTTLVAAFVWRPGRDEVSLGDKPAIGSVGGQLSLLILVLLVIYYFSHRADADDATYVNLAIGAQRTTGAVFQFDTMLGDGPGSIILPTYKFHSFELLGAVISSLTGLEPITVLHLVLPLPQLVLLALIMLLVLAPLAGRNWFAAALLWISFLFLNDSTLASWGLHGIIRFFEGKAFLVTALVPLSAALTVRWFQRGERIDLLGLGLANVCAIGFSANGLYGGPLASAFVAAAFVAAAPRSKAVWHRAIGLLPTISYPVAIAAIIVLFGLALPSEVLKPSGPVEALCLVAGFGFSGHLVLALIALGCVGFIEAGFARAGLIYVPLTTLIILNPVSWPLINAFTGMLGARVFWSLPAAPMSALAVLTLLERIGVRSLKGLLATALIPLGLAIGWNARTSGPLIEKVQWHMPDLKVVRPDYDSARRLASLTARGCSILAPEHVAQWLTTIRHAPYPVFARELYLIHYRFTKPEAERALRERLRLVVDGKSSDTPPSPAEIAAPGISIGTIAVDDTAPSRAAAESLAASLALKGPMHDGKLLVWSGSCGKSTVDR
jgi:Family of unknown function (DUF6077)